MAKHSSNKPSKAGQVLRTEQNKKRHKAQMREAYVKAHGSEEGIPNWDEKPDYTPHKERIVVEMIAKGKIPKRLK